jgi:hypothetical protein
VSEVAIVMRAGQLMGEPVLAGVTVASRGTTAKLRTLMQVSVKEVQEVITTLVDSFTDETVTPGNRRGWMYLAVGPSKIAFFSLKMGLLGFKLEDLIVEHPREMVASFEMHGQIVSSAITINLTDGTVYELEYARNLAGTDARKFQHVMRELGISATASAASADRRRYLSGPPGDGAVGIEEHIRELGRLRDEGLLSEDEFAAKKAELLSKL